MEWAGEKIKALLKENNFSIVKLAEKIGVSRQTVNDWINGQIPKGNHLVAICKIFDINPDRLFSNEYNESISVPVHRTRKTAKVTTSMQKDALNLAKEYDLFFRNDTNSSVLPVVRGQNRTSAAAQKIAKEIRSMVEFDKNRPPNYSQVFQLMEKLGIKVIFRDFPEKIKAYAFYTKIHGHRVVFINNSTNVLDLIFPLLHEAVHAVRDEYRVNDIFDDEEEAFCDLVANYIQFPDEYVRMVYDFIKSMGVKGAQVNALKTFGKNYNHALFGIVKQLKAIDSSFNINIGGADTNLKKGFRTIGEILFMDKEPRAYINAMVELSPLFIQTLLNQIEGLTDRKLGELLGVESILDSKSLKDELKRLLTVPSHEYSM